MYCGTDGNRKPANRPLTWPSGRNRPATAPPDLSGGAGRARRWHILVNGKADLDSKAGRYALRLLATSDLHARIMPYDYAWDRPLPSVGLARVATLIRAARAEVPNALLFDNGDFLEGTCLGERPRLGGRSPHADQHPVIAAMNHLAYDAATLGNHDFGFGVARLEQALSGAAFPLVCANLVRERGPDPLSDRPFLPPVTLLRRVLRNATGHPAEITIGIIGVLPPQVEIWEHRNLDGKIQTRDILEAATAWVPRLKSMGADLIVALCHSGIGGALPVARMENAAVPLAAIPGIDAVIAGHSHRLFPDPAAPDYREIHGVDAAGGTLAGKPAVMAGFWGSHLGLIDLDLARDAAGWRVLSAHSHLRATARIGPDGRIRAKVTSDAALTRLVRAAHKDTLRMIRTPIGHSPRPLHSYFARIEPSAALALVHQAQFDWLARAIGQGALSHLPHLSRLPRLSAASPIKSGGRGGPRFFTDIPAGKIALRHLGDLYHFGNEIAAVVVTGARIRDWLERAAAQYCQIRPGVLDQPLFDADMPAYNFDTIAGLTYGIDLLAAPRYMADGQPVAGRAGRVTDLCFQGAALDDRAAFLVATNIFRANGGGQFAGLNPADIVLDSATGIRDALRQHIEAGATLPPPAPFWRLGDLPPDTGAWFDTGPHGEHYIRDLTSAPVSILGHTADGFLRCRLGHPTPLHLPPQGLI